MSIEKARELTLCGLAMLFVQRHALNMIHYSIVSQFVPRLNRTTYNMYIRHACHILHTAWMSYTTYCMDVKYIYIYMTVSYYENKYCRAGMFIAKVQCIVHAVVLENCPVNTTDSVNTVDAANTTNTTNATLCI